jgi:uncharacterized protein
MKRVKLGMTGLEVSRLCFGGLVIGPLQVNLPLNEGALVIKKALELGVNFIDTAELYGTYPYIRKAMELSGIRPVITSKSYAYTSDGAKKSVEKALSELDIDMIDIFMLHEQESRLTLRGHRDALEYYIRAKQEGIIRAVGVSTHNIEVVEAAADMPEIDVIHPIINREGIGIGDGNIENMLKAVEKAYDAGKGIYAMKALAGGNLSGSFKKSIEFVLELPFVHSIAVGMQSIEEVIVDTALFSGKQIPEKALTSLKTKKRSLHIEPWCEGCGECVKRCTHGALSVKRGKAVVNNELCLLCGYCSSVCPCFAIKVY